MLADFPVLYVDLIVRRTIVSCIALAVVAIVVGFAVGQPLAGVGALLGLGAATVNHRVFQVSTVRYSKEDGHMDRRPYFGTVAARLGGSRSLRLRSCSWCARWALGWSGVLLPSNCC